MRFLWAYIFVINAVALLLMWADKRRARQKRRRVAEATLFLSAALGGSAGAWAGMYMCRHKTRKWKFVFGIPAILALQAAAGWLAYKYV